MSRQKYEPPELTKVEGEMDTMTLLVGTTLEGIAVNLHVKPHSIYREAQEMRLRRGNVLVIDVCYVHHNAASMLMRALGDVGRAWCR